MTDAEWTPATQPAAHGEPVLAEFREWNNPANPVKQQVVWWWEGEWRPYPQTDSIAYCDRWKPLPSAALAAENERLRGLLTAAAQETVALRVMLGAGCDANNDEHHEIIGTGKDAFCHKCGEMTPRGKSKAWFSEERMERIMNRLAARAALDGKS